MTKVSIPDFALVVLIGATGSGKSSFARKHFLETEIVSSDACRAIVSDDETDLAATGDAFDLLNYTASIRLKRRLMTVIDATSVKREDRAKLVQLARKYHALPVALVLDIDPKICHERNQNRPSRDFGEHVARNHSKALRRGMRGLQKEGFRQVQIMKSPEDVDALEIAREPLWTDNRADHGPFDIIGDIHGCFDELTELLGTLGYVIDPFEAGSEDLIRARHPEGRTAFFVGDITDRGPRNLDALRLVMGMCDEGSGRCVVGNHDFKLNKWLKGRNVTQTHGLDLTVSELEKTSDAFRKQVSEFIWDLRSHAWLADGNLVIAHAGLKEEMHGRGSGHVRNFAMFGETTGEVDEFGLPVRLEWARDYRGKADVVFGHTPMADAEWLNHTMCIDTGCVFGGKLTALRWPERETVSVPAKTQYAIPAKPLDADQSLSAQQDHDRLLYFDDYATKMRIETRFRSTLQISEENSLAALEVMSRFAVDPRWLIYLPPTMAACPTAPEGPFLEHPDQAMDHFASRGVSDLVVEEKHMGSRALLVIAKDADAAKARFGVEDGKAGVIFTRTGRPFFKDEAKEAAVVARIGTAMQSSGLWEGLQTDWVLLDAELMPWSAKAQDLLKRQYYPTVAAAKSSASALLEAISKAGEIEGLDALRARTTSQLSNADLMGQTIDGYCWSADSIEDYRIAPFHILATEGKVHAEQPHTWHMETLGKLADADPILQTTGWKRIDLNSATDRGAVVSWWMSHTGSGGEGLVFKPNAFTLRGDKGLIQPAMKVRGRDYLRIIYGPDYDLPEHIERLRQRGLGRKFSLAEREFKLGFEGLHRFVEGLPLSKVHECALAVLALESEPVDPRL
ncbi:polynucleotide 3'-phosphatase/polynucleotide 5'-hydroxyl-kinase/polynucleotide 2',3'-cyclic phosphate phosphodiesterase [Aliiroseovarius halocynthiae]|uniref:Polynucleotide kinase-phosphatase n=1 Tax=Aliiroseovarius halocynthiae TaxID=985055 RepID=A0A545SUT2_9RHOB|nr:polynucleotide kinase-phosphatase [Aliiroseovarius halocynthiae]TQV68720.1 polynucleotide kinase-phosphatase [Aliiroseovarius halocynthiae]SMR71141.1 polynucleotide 3'-phosphatase/polynucleotide 5'-hydroxyl-kinase/polynucleotide 2',3'-cyclic phosphate phosphodiesterase [Aliiroseovarius halocynthiae]